MIYFTTLVAAVLLLGEPEASPPDSLKQEMSRLEGTWETVRAEVNSKPTEKSVGQRVTIKSARFKTGELLAKEFKDGYRIELNAGSPREMDLVLETKDGKEVVRLRCIYLLEGDMFKVCMGTPALGGRPKDFSSGYAKSIVVYKRVEPK